MRLTRKQEAGAAIPRPVASQAERGEKALGGGGVLTELEAVRHCGRRQEMRQVRSEGLAHTRPRKDLGPHPGGDRRPPGASGWGITRLHLCWRQNARTTGRGTDDRKGDVG